MLMLFRDNLKALRKAGATYPDLEANANRINAPRLGAVALGIVGIIGPTILFPDAPHLTEAFCVPGAIMAYNLPRLICTLLRQGHNKLVSDNCVAARTITRLSQAQNNYIPR